MRNHLKIFDLKTYVIEKHEQPSEDDTGLDEWTKAHDFICTTLCICVKENTYSDIENISNAKMVWTTLETNFQL